MLKLLLTLLLCLGPWAVARGAELPDPAPEPPSAGQTTSQDQTASPNGAETPGGGAGTGADTGTGAAGQAQGAHRSQRQPARQPATPTKESGPEPGRAPVAEPFHVLRYNPTNCGCPSFEVFIRKHWIRTRLEDHTGRNEPGLEQLERAAGRDYGAGVSAHYKVMGKLKEGDTRCASGHLHPVYKLRRLVNPELFPVQNP